ncbi:MULTISPECIES: hypothetical protein [Geobacillus]|uniref:Membrane protein YszA n=1 Tax=Geobacillus subterraneus TaxID=129338 RepID=A0A679FKG0_9BACL|nr:MULTISPECIES: hypothetical protein [Geobacillus]KYD26935.1 hypothetical protein B4113_0811 [Geobacillus sp. B4113_201601]NNV05541.1 hypothetical protein [Geobacillus sp. MMMUD3]TWG31402.1 hypothetical protein GC56T2_2616 [Geobacillus sp. C56-T2]BBW95399.1 putative membrane protein YszA [Geobacillus subterraneus]
MRRFNPYSWPPWLRQVRAICAQVIIPLAVFQAIRTILLPTTFDVLLLAILVLAAVAFRLEWI